MLYNRLENPKLNDLTFWKTSNPYLWATVFSKSC